MKILAFDTATESCSVALTEDSRLLSEITLVNTKTHSRQLTRLIREVCQLAETDLNEIDGCAVTRGPGSFTGLRIGVSTALGLAQATGRPIVGVSTLQVLAVQAAAPSQMVCPMIDARRGEVYFATYKHTAKHLVAQQSERALNPGDAVDSIGEPCIFVGSGAVLYHDVIRGRLGEAAKLRCRNESYHPSGHGCLAGLPAAVCRRCRRPYGFCTRLSAAVRRPKQRSRPAVSPAAASSVRCEMIRLSLTID